ncbi:MAG: dihydroneopterin aldolase [Deltaproteobacteria bacterium]|nr:dihydroneopterin aldolase [Deltaproteobacteria bacterium]
MEDLAVSRYAIRLDGIRFRARHGASDSERELPQDFVADLEVTLPVALVPASDERARVYDYDALATLVVREGTASSFRLLESLARRLLERLFAETPALAASLRLRKFGPPTTESVDSAAIELAATRRAG